MDPDPLAFWQATTRAKRAIFLKTEHNRVFDGDPGNAPPEQINITLNWFDELKQHVPVQ
jgi:hypothetical protein